MANAKIAHFTSNPQLIKRIALKQIAIPQKSSWKTEVVEHVRGIHESWTSTPVEVNAKSSKKFNLMGLVILCLKCLICKVTFLDLIVKEMLEE